MRKRPFRRFLQIMTVLIVAGVFIFIWWRRNLEEKETAGEILAPVSVMKPLFGSLNRTLSLRGIIESEAMVTVLPKIQGTLTELYVDVGDPVRKGQIIAVIDSESYELTLKQAEAAFLAAESTFTRTEELYKAKATT